MKISKNFKQDFFVTKRIHESFSSIPVYISLNKTIKVDVASQHKGIGYLVDFVAARRKCAKLNFLRISITYLIYLEHALIERKHIAKNIHHSKI